MSTSQTNYINTCPACNGENLDNSFDEFDYACMGCGFVIHDSTDTSAPDWKVIDESESQPDDADWLATCRVQNSTEQRLAEAFSDIEYLGSYLDLAVDFRRNAADIYCEAFLAETTDGRETTTLVAACVRLASLQAERPVPVGRLTSSLDIESRKFHRSYSALTDDLERTPPTPEPVDYLPFLEREFALEEAHLQASSRMLNDIADNSTFVGKDPSGIAAASIYVAGEELTQSSVAEAVGVSTETVRQRVSELRGLTTDA